MSTENRDRLALRMGPDTKRKIDQWYKPAGCRSKNQFVERDGRWVMDWEDFEAKLRDADLFLLCSPHFCVICLRAQNLFRIRYVVYHILAGLLKALWVVFCKIIQILNGQIPFIMYLNVNIYKPCIFSHNIMPPLALP